MDEDNTADISLTELTDPFEKQKEQKRIIVGLMISTTIFYLLAENIITFLPLYATDEYGLNSLETGVILAMYQVACVCSSPVVGHFLQRLGKKNSILLGYFIMILATFGIGFISFAHNSMAFFWLAFLMRILQGVGTSFNMTAVYSLISYEFPEQRVRYFGYCELCLGMGMFLGPFLSGVLYQFLGFLGTFMFFGCLLIGGLILAHSILPNRLNSNKEVEPRLSDDNESVGPNSSVTGQRYQYSYLFFFVNLDIFLFLFLLSMINMTIFQFENILSKYLTEDLGVSENNIGYVFAVRAFTYACMSLVTPFLTKVITRKLIIAVGVIFVGLANCFMGGCVFLGIPSALWSVIIGMAMLGISSNMVFVVFMPELVALSFNKVDKDNDPVLNDKIAGIFTAYFCFGFFLAPIISGLLADLRDFTFSSNVMAVVDVIIFIVFLAVFICGKSIYERFFKKDAKLEDHLHKLEEDEDILQLEPAIN